MSYNHCCFVGNLVVEPELRYTKDGKPVCNFRIAVNNPYKKDDVLFISVTVWDKQAEASAKYLDKGKSVLVSGRLVENSWEQDGQKRSKMELNANNVEFLGSKTDKTDAPPEESDVEPF